MIHDGFFLGFGWGELRIFTAENTIFGVLDVSSYFTFLSSCFSFQGMLACIFAVL